MPRPYRSPTVRSMSKRPLRILSLVLPALAGTALIAGCDVPRHTLEDGLSQSGAITEIRIAGGVGNVEIVGDSTTGVEVRRIARYRDDKPGQSMTVAGSTLNLDTNCGADCTASYEVRVGRGVRVTGGNDSGNVTLRGVSDVDVRLESGNLKVEGATGTVTLHADSGNIDISDVAGKRCEPRLPPATSTARNLRGAQATLETDSGNIEVSIPGTGDLTASTTSGNVHARLPDRCCRILTSSGSGKVEMDVQQDPQEFTTGRPQDRQRQHRNPLRLTPVALPGSAGPATPSRPRRPTWGSATCGFQFEGGSQAPGPALGARCRWGCCVRVWRRRRRRASWRARVVCRSTAVTNSGESGSVSGLNRATTEPAGSTRNFSKFHRTSPACAVRVGRVGKSVYSGCRSAPLTSTFSVIGNVTPKFTSQNSAISLGRAGLLAAELVARHAEHDQAAVGVRLVQLLQAGVLRREPALRRRRSR